MEEKFKIINKTKTECTLDLRELGKITLGWPEFNQIYKISELYWAEEKPEYKNRTQALKNKIDELIKLSDKLLEEDCSREEILKKIQKHYDALKSDYSLDSSRVVELMKARKEYLEKRKSSIEVFPKYKGKKVTLGDLPVLQKLKAEMEKKKK